jgi:hypothetical protein
MDRLPHFAVLISMDPSPADIERVMHELNEAIAETSEGLSASACPAEPFASDRRRGQRRDVVPDRRIGDRRGA